MRSRNFSYMLLNQLKISGVCQAIIKAARPVNGNQTRPFKNGSSLGVTNSNAFGDQAWNADEEGQMGTVANWTVRASAQGAATIQIQLTVALGSLGSA